MKNAMIPAAILALATFILMGAAMRDVETPFAPNVNGETGALRVPENYTEWPTLGTWAHAHTGEKLEKLGPGVHEYHVVYTQPETITYYRKHGRFPDGAVLVKELLDAKTMAMTTGPAVGHATTIKGWFVLVRDTKGRYKESSLWGDGWAWSLFNADDPEHTVSKNYKTDCIPCHTPARELAPRNAVDADKWIYSFGYPVLRIRAQQAEQPGIAGYDPVAYFTDGKPMRGSGYHVTVHDGVTYAFASKAHKTMFEANPQQYLPAYGGYCAYGAAVGMKDVVDPEAWKIVDGVLYLIQDKGIQKKWENDIPGYIKKADANWPKIRDTAPRVMSLPLWALP